jgi:Protein of unknown function (DUF4085)
VRFFKADANWDQAWKKYEANLRKIRDSLPANARLLSSLSFHDSTIKSVNHLSKTAVEIVIEGGPHNFIEDRWLDYGTYTLSFSGVKKAWVPYTIAGDIWLNEEMNLSDVAAFDYQVRLVQDEFRIQADDVLFTQGFCV